MESLRFAYPLASAALVLIIDLVVWQYVDPRHLRWKMVIRLCLFLLFSLALLDGDLSPLSPVQDGFTPARHTLATVLAFIWWLYGARALTALAVVMLEPRIGGKGHLLQDLMGAIIFLVATVAAAGYVLDLPVKGLLATSGAVAIILGLAVQSTLGDVFSGIVLNATKPFRVDDVISIDDIEGKVIEIDWRSTYLLTGSGSMVVIPNAMAAKTRIINLSRPNRFHSVVLTIELPVRLRPSLVLDSLEKALQGSRDLLAQPKAGAVIRKSGLRSVEYEITGFIKSRDRRGAVRNQLYDLIYRQLAASDSLRQHREQLTPATRESAALNSVPMLRTLDETERTALERLMRLSSYPVGGVILPQGTVSDALLIIESGVVTVAIERSDGWHELGRLGPGDLMGESGIIEQLPLPVRCTALTDCVVYRIDRADLEPWLHEGNQLAEALEGLASFRGHVREVALQHRPAAATPKGLLHWIRKSVMPLPPG
ncbi:mechanosensitive ion channel domain-containing protein [Pseudomonas sp. NA-150]|uniref:mechanosensitive ion channel domain-containing protein n=1 Tax=Pseudomonas sp. NA-150 TaxID=3367525 RepID=UPI0037CBB254